MRCPFLRLEANVIKLRCDKESDRKGIIHCFIQAVHYSEEKFYSRAQRLAWAPLEEQEYEASRWSEMFKENRTLVALHEYQVVGFADLRGDGYVDRLFVLPTMQRRGIASQLLKQLEQFTKGAGHKFMTTDASENARPFFDAHGFKLVRRQMATIRGMKLSNYTMKKQITH